MFAQICGISIFHESLGRGLPLFCLHGSGVDHRSIKSGMESVLNGLSGIQRIYFDLPGMGQSQTHPQILSSDDMLEIVLQFIDEMIGPDQPFVLAGYSYGGYLARGVVAEMPRRVKGMMLLCPVINLSRHARHLPRFKCCERDQEFVDGLTDEQFSLMDQFVTIQTPDVWDNYLSHIHPALSLADPGLMKRIRDSGFSRNVDDPRLPVYDGPVLVLTGRYDVTVGYEDVWKIYPRFSNGEFVVLDRAGHLLHMEAPELFQTHVRNWMQRVVAD
ncbi:MAG: alpha/beta hydrolase [Desulfobacter sp.]|nr:alpha/beta hydrolase [Desulfobacter sp.]WDP87743.1 MAG: alpha/beta hydrolase [Desulfobacter sp.]